MSYEVLFPPSPKALLLVVGPETSVCLGPKMGGGRSGDVSVPKMCNGSGAIRNERRRDFTSLYVLTTFQIHSFTFASQGGHRLHNLLITDEGRGLKSTR